LYIILLQSVLETRQTIAYRSKIQGEMQRRMTKLCFYGIFPYVSKT